MSQNEFEFAFKLFISKFNQPQIEPANTLRNPYSIPLSGSYLQKRYGFRLPGYSLPQSEAKEAWQCTCASIQDDFANFLDIVKMRGNVYEKLCAAGFIDINGSPRLTDLGFFSSFASLEGMVDAVRNREYEKMVPGIMCRCAKYQPYSIDIPLITSACKCYLSLFEPSRPDVFAMKGHGEILEYSSEITTRFVRCLAILREDHPAAILFHERYRLPSHYQLNESMERLVNTTELTTFDEWIIMTRVVFPIILWTIYEIRKYRQRTDTPSVDRDSGDDPTHRNIVTKE